MPACPPPRGFAGWLLFACWLVASAPARGQTGLAQHDSTLPIEIAADQLTVEQGRQQAAFSGNVQAVQGDLTLRADRLLVHYDLGKEGAAAQAVRLIEAEGQVVIASPAESATANRAVYDVVAGTIVLEGSVVLTRGEDVVKGGRLDIDLANKTAVLHAAGSERVRALFRPSSLGRKSGG